MSKEHEIFGQDSFHYLPNFFEEDVTLTSLVSPFPSLREDHSEIKSKYTLMF